MIKNQKPTIVMCCANYWNSPLQVGSHHLARAFERRGWRVAFISDPISLAHLLQPSYGLWCRIKSYLFGGAQQENIWSYVSGGIVIPYYKWCLSSVWLHRHWQYFSWPRVLTYLKKYNFFRPDLLYFDSPMHGFLFDVLEPKCAIYRLADYNQAFVQTAPAKGRLEEALIKRVDSVMYTAQGLENYVKSLKPRSMYYLPNGVDVEHFLKPCSKPLLYKRFSGRRIAVYVGALREWFDVDLICQAARSLPNMEFVIIGPNQTCHFDQLPNLHLTGPIDWQLLPGYLQHAAVGMIPFDVKRFPELVHAVNPLKLYEYMASGLPVVSVEWEELKRLETPAILTNTHESFIYHLKTAQKDADYIEFAKNHSWNFRVDRVVEFLHNPEKKECVT